MTWWLWQLLWRSLVLFVVMVPLAVTGCIPSAVNGRRPSSRDLVLAPVDDSAAFAAPAVQGALDRVTGYPRRPGNSARLLISGQATDRRFETGRDADIILAKTFQLSEDEIGWQMTDLLCARARAGAYVVLQYEPKMAIEDLHGLGDMLRHSSAEHPLGERRLVRLLRAAGVIVVPANPPDRFLSRGEWRRAAQHFLKTPGAVVERTLDSLQILDYSDHEKYWITGHRQPDGSLLLNAILGGTSLGSAYGLGGKAGVRDRLTGDAGWRDTDIELYGPIVNDITARFLDLMEYHLGQPLSDALRAQLNPPQAPRGSALVRFAFNQPLIANTRATERAYTTLIGATPAGGVVRIETAYFAPIGELRDSLLDALRRGTRLTLITNSAASDNHAITTLGARTVFAALLRVDPTVVLLERAPRPDIGEQTLHSKIASFGTRGPVIVGSPNFDGQATEHCSESLVIVDDAALRQVVDEVFVRDFSADRVDRVTLEVLRQDSLWRRIEQRAVMYLGGYYL